MLLPIITDLHFGHKNSHQAVREYFFRFFENTFFPYLDKHGIKEIINLGDTLDNRKFCNIETLMMVRNRFFNPLEARGVKMHTIIGNHDVYYKSNNLTNSMAALYSRFPCMELYTTCQDVDIGGKTFAMLPWISPADVQDFNRFLGSTKAKIAMGHLEILGYEVLRGVKSEEGMDPACLKVFDRVYSGHFHKKNGDSHIQYLGTAYDMDFGDLDEVKGFHVLNTDTMELEFIQNPEKMFVRLVYDGVEEIPDFSPVTGKYVKLQIKSKKDPNHYDKYIEKLYEANPEDVDPIEEYELLSTLTEQDIDVTEDTLSIIYKDIDNRPEITDKIGMKNLMNSLYIESHEIE